MKKHLRILAYIGLVFGLIVLFSRQMTAEEGKVYSELEFVTYDNVLYSPEELHALTEEQKAAGHVGWDYDYYAKEFSRVRTNQLILHLTPGQTYGLYSEQLTYASSLWIDGHLMAKMGTVADTPEASEPRTGSVVVYFTAGEETEIVMQRCNFVHAKWNAVKMYIDTQDIIARQVQTKNFKEIAYLGFLFALGIFNLGMFMGMPGRKRYLWFALSCFATMVHHSVVDPKTIMQIFPTLSWYVSYKTEEISLLLLMIFLLLFLRDCFGRSLWKGLDYLVFTLLAGLILATLVLPTTLYTRYTVQTALVFAASGVVYCLLLFIKAIIRWRQLVTSQKYYLAGLLVFMITALLAVLGIGPVHVNQIRVGIILFELTSTLALAMEFLDMQKAYLESRHKENELRQMNESMEQTQKLQENFMTIMNHEMRTPLTVIAGYADLSARQLEKEDPPDRELIRNLQLVKQEALRLGRIVEQSDEGARGTVINGQFETTSVRRLLMDARDFCLPICEKRNNDIEIDCPEDLSLSCLRDSVLQALYNLVLNASRHTDRGVIRLTGQMQAEEVLLLVRDDGEGMDEETIRHAFERGYTKDGGHGLGLSLCQEIAERHHGRIWITPNPDRGITVTMAFPAKAIRP